MNTAVISREPELVAAERALIKQQAPVPSVTNEQLGLIKRTVAKDATPDELKLYLYDCARQGVHPLDKLIHFTKRSGKYTPITSIDFMRIRAAESGEYAGSDDARYDWPVDEQSLRPLTDGAPKTASVTVWRLVQGQRCSFAATARWSEYKPDQNDFMWKKMPHTMLAKCAEALALRKGFPRQLAGLYAAEELDQAQRPEPTTIVQAPALAARKEEAAAIPSEPARPSVPNGGASGRLAPVAPEIVPTDIPDGAVLIKTVTAGRAGGKSLGAVILMTGEELPIYKQPVKEAAERACQDGVPVKLAIKVSSTSGKPYLDNLTRAGIAATPRELQTLTDADIPFAWMLPLVLACLGAVLA